MGGRGRWLLGPPACVAEECGDGWYHDGADDEGVDEKAYADDESDLGHDADGTGDEAEHAGGEDEAC